MRAISTASGKRCTMCERASGTWARSATVGGGKTGVACAHSGQSMVLRTWASSLSPCTTTFMVPMAEQTTSMVLGCRVAAKTDTPTNNTYQTSTRRLKQRRGERVKSMGKSRASIQTDQCLCIWPEPWFMAEAAAVRAGTFNSTDWRLPSLPSTTSVTGTVSPSLT